MSALESRYRRALLWYPTTWREQNADIVVGTLMDEADATGRTKPRPSEVLSLTANGLRTRLSVAHGWIHPLAFSRVSDIAFALGSVLSLVMLIGFEWAPWAPPIDPSFGIGFGPFVTAAAVLEIAWVVAFVAALLGLARASSILLGVAIVVAIAITAAGPIVELALTPSFTILVFFEMLAALALIGRRHSRPAPLLIGAAGAGLFVAIVLGATPRQLTNVEVFPDRLLSFAVTSIVIDFRLLALGFVAVIAVAAIARSRQWLHAGIVGLVVCLELALVFVATYSSPLSVVLPNAIAIAATLFVVRRRSRPTRQARP